MLWFECCDGKYNLIVTKQKHGTLLPPHPAIGNGRAASVFGAVRDESTLTMSVDMTAYQWSGGRNVGIDVYYIVLSVDKLLYPGTSSYNIRYGKLLFIIF